MVNKISRRQFLKRSGAAVAGVRLGTTHGPDVSSSYNPTNGTRLFGAISEKGIVGRAFTLTDVFTEADRASSVVGQMVPDSVTSIIGRKGTWYEIADEDLHGYVPYEALQPMPSYQRPMLVADIGSGFWAELVAPTSAIREWCAATAPVVVRLAFGAVVYVMDRLVDDRRQVWYGLAESPGGVLVGWAPALHYSKWVQPEKAEAAQFPTASLLIQRHELWMIENGRILARAPIRSGRLPKLTTIVSPVQPGVALDTAILLGVPWMMRLETGQRMYGVFWHNQFGGVYDGPDIELPIFAARWLYHWLGTRGGSVTLVIEDGGF
jgi:hypothetical protein